MNYQDSNDDCPSCGSSYGDRVNYAAGADDVPVGLGECPHCNATKCSMCDMGDDVECMNCGNDSEQ